MLFPLLARGPYPSCRRPFAPGSYFAPFLPYLNKNSSWLSPLYRKALQLFPNSVKRNLCRSISWSSPRDVHPTCRRGTLVLSLMHLAVVTMHSCWYFQAWTCSDSWWNPTSHSTMILLTLLYPLYPIGKNSGWDLLSPPLFSKVYEYLGCNFPALNSSFGSPIPRHSSFTVIHTLKSPSRCRWNKRRHRSHCLQHSECFFHLDIIVET